MEGGVAHKDVSLKNDIEDFGYLRSTHYCNRPAGGLNQALLSDLQKG